MPVYLDQYKLPVYLFQYEVDRETSLRAKLNNSRQLGLSYSQLIRPGIRLCLSSLIDGMNLNQVREGTIGTWTESDKRTEPETEKRTED